MLSPVDLLGTWRLDRRVADRRLGATGRMTGTLTLSRSSEGVAWHEQGRFTFAGRDYDSYRDLLVVRDGAEWIVCFADGRPFHPWRPGSTVTHPCGADTYCGLVDATSERLRVLWDVTGPAKDQRILTRCRRLPRPTPLPR